MKEQIPKIQVIYYSSYNCMQLNSTMSIYGTMLEVPTWIPHSSLVHSLAFEFLELILVSVDGKTSLINMGKLFATCKPFLGKNVSKDESYFNILHGNQISTQMAGPCKKTI